MRIHKERSSVNPTSTHKKSNDSDSSRSFFVQRKPEKNSAQEEEPRTYSRTSYDLLIANVMRSMEARAQEAEDQKSQQEQLEQGNNSHEILSKVGVQTKLTVGAVGDKYEQEADQMAARVISMPAPTIESPIQRQEAPAEEEEVQMKPLGATFTPFVQRQEMPEQEEEEVQTKPLDNAIQREMAPEEEEEMVQTKPSLQQASEGGSLQANSDIESRLNSSKGGGSPLPDDVRNFMEPRFGADFSGVQVHTGSEAVQMNRELGAQAFTHGSDVYFGAGKSPGNNDLTAHELTHVVQQSGSSQLQRQTGSIPIIQRFSSAGFQSEMACALLSDEQIYNLFVKVYFSSQPNARAHLVHYRNGGGKVYRENVEALFTANPRIRTRIAQLIEQQIADGTATTKGSLVGRGVDDGADPPIRQSDYDSEDWRNANGNIDQADWEIVGSYKPNDYNRVQIKVTDPYEWHPAEGRPTQCLHAAFERLKTKGAADYITQGTASLILPPTRQSPDVPLESEW